MFTQEEIKSLQELDILKRSEKLVHILFDGKCDKANANYLNHLHHVSEDFKSQRQRSMALMHDVLEDTDITKEELMKLGYDEEFINCLEILTHKDESYEEYIDKIISSKNKEALEIKIKDILHNMDLTRLTKITKKDINRTKKYINAYLKILEVMEGETND